MDHENVKITTHSLIFVSISNSTTHSSTVYIKKKKNTKYMKKFLHFKNARSYTKTKQKFRLDFIIYYFFLVWI